MNIEPPSKIEAKKLHERLYSKLRPFLKKLKEAEAAGAFNNWLKDKFSGRYLEKKEIKGVNVFTDIYEVYVDFKEEYFKVCNFSQESILFLITYGDELKGYMKMFLKEYDEQIKEDTDKEEKHWKDFLDKISNIELDKI